MSGILAMIPARMGSQRLVRKNLRKLDGVTLIARAIRRCRSAECFDEIWVNSEHADFASVAEAEGVRFHRRPEPLGDDTATSEDYLDEFLRGHPCTWLVQVHGIAPLVTVEEVRGFVSRLSDEGLDALIACEHIQIECALDGSPVNFTFSDKTNSQDLRPVQRVSWSMAAWRREAFLAARDAGQCATWSGRTGFHPVDHLAAHVIKTEADLQVAEALLPVVEQSKGTTT